MNRIYIKNGLLFVFIICCMMTAGAQPSLTFRGQDSDGSYVQLHHVVIEDVTQGWADTLFYPDTILILSGIGVQDYELPKHLILSQNTPNPFDGVTDFTLAIPNEDKTIIEVFDMMGRKVTDRKQHLAAGMHTFRVWLNMPQQYVLTVRTTRETVSIKMMNNGAGGYSRIAYNGEPIMPYTLRSSRGGGYASGDLLRITGFRMVDGHLLPSDTVEITTIPDEIVTLLFAVFDECPYVTTGVVTSITRTSAYCSGEVLSEGLTPVTERGFCWDTLPEPTMMNEHIAVGTGLGVFSDSLSGLDAGTTYYCRAYATNTYGTVYGETVIFTTAPNVVPVVMTTQVSSITDTSATVGGSVIDDGGLPVLEQGICWGMNSEPTLADNYTVATTTNDSFSCALTNLLAATHYYARAYATNAVGTGYGAVADITTEYGFPSVSLDSITMIGSSYATCHGTLLSDGGDPATTVGLCWALSPSPTVADNHVEWGGEVGTFSRTLGGIHDTVCYVRSYATNIVGTVYGNTLMFTPDTMPTSMQVALVHLDHNYATIRVTVVCDSTASIADRGLCMDTLPQPDTSDVDFSATVAANTFDIHVGNLERASTYYLRGHCLSNGTLVYSDDFVLLTVAEDGQPCIGTPTLTDYEGHVYNTVQVGSQCWMKSNLYTTHFPDGTAIAYGGSGAGSYSTSVPYYYRHSLPSSQIPIYGHFYNWKALTNNSTVGNVDAQGICPDGWHIPDNSEWVTLRVYTGAHYACGDDSMSVAKALADEYGWNSSTANCSPGASPNNNNLTGFSAIPSGGNHDVTFNYGQMAYHWSRSTHTEYYTQGYVSKIAYNNHYLSLDSFYLQWAFPVRCLRDE